jgi:ferrous iron transport protein A
LARDDVYAYNKNHSHLNGVLLSIMQLCDLPYGQSATVESVQELDSADHIATRLRDLGFVAGEPVRIVARGPIGADPLLIQIGFTRFALRRSEAARVFVKPAA